MRAMAPTKLLEIFQCFHIVMAFSAKQKDMIAKLLQPIMFSPNSDSNFNGLLFVRIPQTLAAAAAAQKCPEIVSH